MTGSKKGDCSSEKSAFREARSGGGRGRVMERVKRTEVDQSVQELLGEGRIKDLTVSLT